MWRILALVERGHTKNQVQRTINAKDRSITFVSTLDSAIGLLNSETFHVLIIDDELVENRMDRILEACRLGRGSHLPVLILTNFRKGHTRLDLEGLFNWTCVKKPINQKILQNTVQNLLDMARLPNVINYLRHKEKYIYHINDFISASPSMKSVMNLVKKIAASNSSVLITGEAGTGKEMIAAALHFNSPRREDNFVSVNCMALPEPILEKELFGHEKSSEQGDEDRRIGRIEQGNAGSLFLKEISALSLTVQAKILRVIQHKEFERLHGTQKVKVDIRLICSSSQDLKEHISRGGFREDLFYRINVININIPALRERKEDIPALAQFFLYKYRSEFSKNELGFSPKSIETLMEYDWPGNVRELENVIERAIMICAGQTVEPDQIVLHAPMADAAKSGFFDGESLNLDQLERSAIMEALTRANGVQKVAAEMLGIEVGCPVIVAWE